MNTPIPRQRKLVHFGGCGFLYNYFLGVTQVFREEMTKASPNAEIVFSGVSAGVVPALVLAISLDPRNSWSEINEPIFAEVRSTITGVIFNWNDTVRRRLRISLAPNAFQIATGRFRLHVTSLPSFVSKSFDTFESNDDLIEGFLASSFLPVYDRRLWQSWRSLWCWDGALSLDSKHLNKDSEFCDVFLMTVDRWRPQWSSLWRSGHELFLHSNISTAINLFELGVADAHAHITEIQKFLMS